MVIELRPMEYEESLEALGLTTLKEKRKRVDLIQLYKIINKMEVVDIDMGIGNNHRTAKGDRTRGHGYQIEKELYYPQR